MTENESNAKDIACLEILYPVPKMDYLQTVRDVVRMTAAYFGLDVEVWTEATTLKENLAECEDNGAGVYTIYIDHDFLKEDDVDELVRIVAHEMVHVKQFECNELCLEYAGAATMNGVEYRGDYWFSPWEIEARGYQDAFLHHYNSGNAEKLLDKHY